MVRFATTLAAVGLGLAAAACDKSDDGKSLDIPSAKPVTPTGAIVSRAPAADPLASAENRSQVTLYTDMIRFPPQPKRIAVGVTATFRASPRGEPIDIVESGPAVSVVGKRSDYYLVVYPDLTDGTKQLAGWIYRDAVDADTWPAFASRASPGAPASARSELPAKLVCRAGDVILRTSGDFCGRTCASDAECAQANGGLCDGTAFEVKRDGTAGATMRRYCVVSMEEGPPGHAPVARTAP